MKTSYCICTILAIAVATSAQFISIAAPAEGSTLRPGSNFTIEVDRSNTNSESHEVAILIALAPGGPQACLADSSANSLLYVGQYNPQLDPGSSHKPANQNFTFVVPESFPSGTSQLSVTRFYQLGASRGPSYEYKSVTVNIAA